jgi:hypothetical protein
VQSRLLVWVAIVVLICVLAGPSHPARALISLTEEATHVASSANHGCTLFCLDNDGYCVFGTDSDNTIQELFCDPQVSRWDSRQEI